MEFTSGPERNGCYPGPGKIGEFRPKEKTSVCGVFEPERETARKEPGQLV
jgi:hypothetical protein